MKNLDHLEIKNLLHPSINQITLLLTSIFNTKKLIKHNLVFITS